MTARQLLARIVAQRLETALLDAILVRLCDQGRILPGEELHREPWGNGTVAYEMPPSEVDRYRLTSAQVESAQVRRYAPR